MRIKRSWIYQIVNEINGKSYVGSSKDITNRWGHWRASFKKEMKYKSLLQMAIRKYGLEHFTFILLEECEPTKEMLEAREDCYFDLLKPEYNILQKAYSPAGHLVSQETRDKISAANKGLKRTEEQIKEMAILRKNISDDTRDKMSQSKIGTVKSDQTKQKMSESHIGLDRSEEHIKNNIQSRNINRLTKLKQIETIAKVKNDIRPTLRRLSSQNVIDIRESFEPDNIICKKYDCSAAAIRKIRKRETYKDITNDGTITEIYVEPKKPKGKYIRIKTLSEFIEFSKNVHGDKYDYSEFDYINNTTKGKIKCSDHGTFEQIPRSHMYGYGCLQCGFIQTGEKLKHHK
jgi:group I intron endonuclease